MPYGDLLTPEAIGQVVITSGMSGAFAVPARLCRSPTAARRRQRGTRPAALPFARLRDVPREDAAAARGWTPRLARDRTTHRAVISPAVRSQQIWLHDDRCARPDAAQGGRATAEQRWDLVRYVASIARKAPWDAGGRLDGAGHSADLTRRGEYLVRAEMCGLCHTQINSTGIYRSDDAYLGGGQRVIAYPHGAFVTSNLTPDPEIGIGRWSDEEIAAATREGRAPDRTLSLWTCRGTFFSITGRRRPGDARTCDSAGDGQSHPSAAPSRAVETIVAS